MATQDLRFRLLGEDAGASRALSKVQHEAEGTHAAFGNLGRQLTNLGGPFSVVQEGFESVATGLEHVKEHGKSVGSVLVGIGAAATGAGVLLTQFGAKDQQAQAQLRASVENTGTSWDGFREKVEETVRSQERFGHTADDTQGALNNLTVALQDPNKALEEMSVVADLAAKRHMTLAEASTTLIKAQEGSAKAFRDLGIVLDGNGTKTEQINRALDEMQKRLSGQASAAADTFSGKLQAMRAHAEDFLSSLAKYAPALLAIGPLTTAAGAAFSYLAKAKAENVAADAALIPAEEGVAASEIAVASGGAAAATALSAVAKGGALALAGFAAGDIAASHAGSRQGSNLIGDTLKGAGVGGAIGAIGLPIPVVGEVTTVGGATIGAGVGLATGAIHNLFGGGGEKDKKAAADAAEASKKLSTAIEAIGQSAAKTTPKLDQEIAGLHKFTDAAIQSSSTGDQFHRSLNDLNKAVDASNHSLHGNSDAAISNRDALRTLASQELAHIDALKAQGKSSDDVRAAAQRMSSQLETQATKVLGNKHAVDQFLRSLGVLPSQIRRTLGDLSVVGRDIGAQLDAGLTVGIRQNGDKVTLATKTVIDNVIHTAHVTAALGSPSKKTRYIGEMLAEGLIVGFNSKESKLKDALEKPLRASLDHMRTYVEKIQAKGAANVSTARNQLGADIDARNQYAQGLAGNLASTANLTGAIDPTTGQVGHIGTFLDAMRNQMAAFAATLTSLKRSGLSGSLLQQVAEAGPGPGNAIGQAIISGGSIPALNALQGEIQQYAQQSADTTANSIYGTKIAQDRKNLADQLAEQKKANKILELIAQRVAGEKSAAQVQQELLRLKRTTGVALGLS